MKTINELIETVKECTQDNDHSGALLAIAEYYKMRKFIKILDGISTIHQAEQHLPYYIAIYRNQLSEQMRTIIKNNDPTNYDAICGAL